MLTLRFAREGVSNAALAETCSSSLATLLGLPGIVGLHLCRADAAISERDSAEKQARSDGINVPRWVPMAEGGDAIVLAGAGTAARAALLALAATAFQPAS